MKTKKVCKSAEAVAEIVKSAEAVAEVIKNTQLAVSYNFPCPIYVIERPDFLDMVNTVSEEALVASRKTHDLNDIYPVYMSEAYENDARIAEFSEFVAATAWNILNEQGYAMHDKLTLIAPMWAQEHYKHSSMEAHVHGQGAQIVGFYFLETPENCSRVVFHDPRAGKVQIDLQERDMGAATIASQMINFEPKPGMLIFANSWLMHSFTRHAAEEPIKFVHFNVGVVSHQVCNVPPSSVEIV